ncbi:oligosaccharide flippase family protein [Saccharibacillus sp. CPCC 101409]|uniref:oligosaccharide flippase family protein n=1 Tax=Saccharibacillus sp. CPCC 101409 TaxID=3058041 RepID=UPI002670EDA9|nr:oligosaccharide flippase family protein [Saccharibacillus sp. CPCC 101409]MDO3412902.1 oligosaccharide flippase family protein [Saccharibacillus sp. CPCC 101409]
MKTSGSSGLLRGAFILGAAALLSKLIGTLQKIPLQNIGGDGVFGIYTTVYSLYAFLAVFVSTALPAAISKFVAERIAGEDERGARRVLRAGLLTAGSVGALLALLMWTCAPMLSGWIGSSHTQLPLRAVSLALLVVPPMAALRGFFQGMQQALPTAVSQVCEQIARVGVMIALLLTLNAAGASDESIAAGAAIGSAAGGLAGLGVMLEFWRRYGRARRGKRSAGAGEDASGGAQAGSGPARDETTGFGADSAQLRAAAALRAGAEAADSAAWNAADGESAGNGGARREQGMPGAAKRAEAFGAAGASAAAGEREEEVFAAVSADAAALPGSAAPGTETAARERGAGGQAADGSSVRIWIKRLLIYAVPVFVGSLSQPLLGLVDTLTVPRLLHGSGWGDLASMEQFGIYNRGIPLVQLVFMLATSLSTLLLPAIAEAKARGEEERIAASAGVALRWLWLLGLTAAAGLAALAGPVNVMLYADAQGTDALRWTALSAAGGTLGIVSAALLQGMGAVRAPALFLLVSAALKLVLNLLLVPQMGISGAALAGAVSYMTAALLGVLMLARLTGLRGGARRTLLQPLLLAGLTALAAYAVRLLCGGLLSAAGLGGRAGALLTSAAGVAAGVVVFAAALVFTRAVSDAELSALPGGAKLAALARRMRRES